ncbi:MAG: hypothetical protein EXS41_09210 [Opitutaceae bacterium]|nr:hypothetical protein [Opitutaceae bacterium]
MEKSRKANEGNRDVMDRGGSLTTGRARTVEDERNSLCLHGERKNGAAPHEAYPGLPAHLGTMETGQRASDVRLKCIPLVKQFRAARPDTSVLLVEVAARKLDFQGERIR